MNTGWGGNNRYHELPIKPNFSYRHLRPCSIGSIIDPHFSPSSSSSNGQLSSAMTHYILPSIESMILSI